jgi:hypothetical protein
VFFKPDGAGVAGDKMVEALRKRGVLLAMRDGRIRACTHLDVSAAMIEERSASCARSCAGRDCQATDPSSARQQCAPATAHCRAANRTRRSTCLPVLEPFV